MLVGVCCTCQQGGKPLRYIRGRALIDAHKSFGSSCEGEGTAPQATYEIASGSDQMPEGVQVVNGNGLPIVKDQIPGTDTDHIPDSHSWIDSIPIGSTEGLPLFPEHNVRAPDIYPDDFDREQAKEAEKLVCCFDPWCNHRSDSKPAGVFGTIGDLILAAKNGKKTKKRG